MSIDLIIAFIVGANLIGIFGVLALLYFLLHLLRTIDSEIRDRLREAFAYSSREFTESLRTAFPSFSRQPYWSYDRLGRDPYLYEELSRLVSLAERERGVYLTWAAREMLILPAIEAAEGRGPFDSLEFEQSVNKIIDAAGEEPDTSVRDRQIRNSQAIIRGFYARFCNIPPFCNRRGESSR